MSWTLLQRRDVLLRRHILVLASSADLSCVSFRHLNMFEFVVFAFDANQRIDTRDYMVQIVKCPDNMTDIRCNLKLAYRTSALGHVYVINERIPMYGFLKEWYVQSHLEVYQIHYDTFVWEIPHVLVFDLDNTLISDEERVQIRDDYVYESLSELKEKGCVLVLWSYGNREHVTHSMNETRLNGYFDIVICGGQRVTDAISRVIVDNRSKMVFVEKPFYLDIEQHTDRLPKSPRVVLWYLRKIGVNYIKTLTLVDDLKDNDYSYDFFLNVRRCMEPRQDWQKYHDQLLDNIYDYESQFSC
ncbi:38K protein [Agrotis ipsilon multiple nucleopolyhedrovirus]|uniref:38K protein n=1 Tax=Agrotis ipsilon multiple nucleopolyhedrovirus TaxID=208013 RepID=B6D5Z5_9ABAC|nr:38K protein [Agrotis ipsilon multiple nucleopolyhedrovirus]ACI28783.1 38K protein [Agrotis ipsilon multiple nucleopolyhedrovirus]